MEKVLNKPFWKGKRVLVTGHTGFKGTWLSLWLESLGANVSGLALPPATNPSMFQLTGQQERMASRFGDVRDLALVEEAFAGNQPEIVVHMAAQPLVSASYVDPVATYSTNIMGTVNVLEAARRSSSVRVVLNVTSDKCYENREWVWGYRESDPMGGHDPYSSSKGCAELVAAAYSRSFFSSRGGDSRGVALGSARAGNVIGGGDWSADRIIPDVVRAITAGERVVLRNPGAIRPWQHVLEPLSGYLLLSQALWEGGGQFVGGWNFGPAHQDVWPVARLVEEFVRHWGHGIDWGHGGGEQVHEAHCLKLDSSKAVHHLKWKPRWSVEEALRMTAQWYRAWSNGFDMREVSLEQIDNYERAYTED